MAEPDIDWLRPRWSQPGVAALMTSRNGGVGRPPFDSLNLRDGLGDDGAAVASNLRILQSRIAATPVWLQQVHGNRVVNLSRADAEAGAAPHSADASVSSIAGLACVVQVADCLPVLLSARGRAVAAAHAGWRGLAAGVIEATLAQLCAAADCAADEVEAWLGACIGPRQFEVGEDVLRAFGADPTRFAEAPPANASPANARFVARGADRPGKWLADLSGLAVDRLRRAGVQQISCADQCTVEQPSRFFSYRRDGVTGRMAAAIWLPGD